MNKYVIKFKLDDNNPYVIKNQLRTDNKFLGSTYDSIEEAQNIAEQWDYDLSDIEIISIEV